MLLQRRLFASGMRAVLIAWTAALAIAFQCIVVQGHVHFSEAPAWSHQASAGGASAGGPSLHHAVATVASSDDVRTGHDPLPTDPAGCFVCQQIAMAGAAVLPDSPTPIMVKLDSIVHLAIVEVAAPRTRASHDWRSRAPPIRL